ncbi:MAG: zinc ABC transporter substrate-binding protein [Elusimicrobiota bacterium]
MKKMFFAVIVVALIVLGIVLALSQRQKPKDGIEKLLVVTTLFPLYDFARNIGQDKVEVSLLLPPGVEAHSFEPKPSDIVRISQADVFIYTGKFMEPWVEDILQGVYREQVKVVEAGMGTKMIPAVSLRPKERRRAMDPHSWLDFDNAQTMVDNIAEVLAEKDAVNADFYRQKAGEYKNSLAKLDIEYKTALSACPSKEIIYGGHYAFGYLASRYGLKYLAAQGVSPDAEPTAQDLVHLVEQIKQDKIEYVFYEELAGTKIAETLAHETKAKLLMLNAGHNLSKEDFENQVSFRAIMEENLQNLKIGLRCPK